MEISSRQINSWFVKERIPDSQVPHETVLLLHGWTGDENVMWIFAPRLPKKAFLISPRGLFPTSKGGYGWQETATTRWPSIKDLEPAAEALNKLMVPEKFPGAVLNRFHIVGFSQGAALGFAYSILFPDRMLSVAGLSGFLPENCESYLVNAAIKNLPVFIAHGTQDDLVPIEKARYAIQTLEKAGADVLYCEDDVGHKLSVSCFRSLEHFYAIHYGRTPQTTTDVK